jgi:hypothetical protein
MNDIPLIDKDQAAAIAGAIHRGLQRWVNNRARIAHSLRELRILRECIVQALLRVVTIRAYAVDLAVALTEHAGFNPITRQLVLDVPQFETVLARMSIHGRVRVPAMVRP